MKRPEEYPLSWPPGVNRHERHTSAQFRTTLAGARENVRKSLKMFGQDSDRSVGEVIISSNVVGISGKMPADPGVAVWFMWDGEFRCIAVDRYSKVEWNLQAIHHVIEAERTKLRHGGLHIVQATFRAYMAIAGPGQRPWRTVLGIKGRTTAQEVKDRFRELAAKHHPDKGGSHEQMAELSAARDQAIRELK
ncbi:MAG: DnaJ domain-containing protein [Pseudomonadota bacterium]